jgi:tetratricopeptide (TPR) repeat protein
MASRPQKKKASAASPRTSLFSNGRFWLPRAALIAGLTFLIFWPALEGGWVWDDTWYIPENPLMQNVAGLWKFWFRPGTWVEYYPIQETVQWMQWHFWGANTLGYHLTNVVLHIVSALLVWRLLAQFGLRFAWVGGLLFAVHPAQVESVAWISELKNTLSLPFYLLAMCAWIDYEENGSKKDYQSALGLFFIGMLCKISLAPFPVLILLYAWWKRGRIGWGDLRNSAFFFAIALVLGMVSIEAGRAYLALGNDPPASISLGGPLSRVAGAGLILAAYFSRALLPIQALLTYPQWVDSHLLMCCLAWLGVAGLLFWFWKKRQGWGRHAILGLGFFLINLGPFLGFNAVSYMNFTWVMDHFLYVPLIGLIGLVVAAMGDLAAKRPGWMNGMTAILAVTVALLTWESRTFAGWFASEEAFWTAILERNPNAWIAHHDLGGSYLDQGQNEKALNQFQQVVRLNPQYSNGYYNKGIALDRLGKTAEAEEQYRQALAVDPHNAKAFINLGGVLIRTGLFAEAIDSYRHAVELRPDDPSNHYDLGSALLRSNQIPAAVEQLKAAVALDPGLAVAHENLGTALARSGNISGAIDEFAAAIEIDPSYVTARDNLGLALAQTGHFQDALAQFQMALQTNPDDANARQALGKLQELMKNQPAPR